MAGNNAKKTGASKKGAEKAKGSQLTLEDVIVALQKSFSRVSAKSADVPPENARAMVAGQVNFEMALKVDTDADYLCVTPKGTIDLKISGVVDTDIRNVGEEEENA